MSWRRHLGHPENVVDDPSEGFPGGKGGFFAFLILAVTAVVSLSGIGVVWEGIMWLCGRRKGD